MKYAEVVADAPCGIISEPIPAAVARIVVANTPFDNALRPLPFVLPFASSEATAHVRVA
nr:hypothetical protein [Caballeronia arationis]